MIDDDDHGRADRPSQPGVVDVLADAAVVSTPALDLSDRFCTEVDCGLSRLAVDPLFVAKRNPN